MVIDVADEIPMPGPNDENEAVLVLVLVQRRVRAGGDAEAC
jgi:hypothetical protein